ncbi:MAG TPA: acetate--CoA ligase family protein, partial [Stellaceae bacterium]
MRDGGPASLDRFLAPAAIAIIGASPDSARIRGRLLHLLHENGYSGKLYPVNPSYREIDGVPCFPSLGAIGQPIDLALIAIPAETVLPALAECAAAGVGHAVIISSGFAEQGGAQTGLQQEIAALARRTGLRVCGPNAEGFHNDVAHVAATFSPAVEVKPGEARLEASPRRVGVVAQSGGMGFALYNRGRAVGLAFSSIVSTGNEADLTASEFFAHLAHDPATSVILLFLESVRDPEVFLAAAAAAAERGKPVVAVKIGRSAAGERAARSHTASMAGWNAAYDAVFVQHGIIRADDPDEAVAIAAAFATAPAAQGPRVAVVTASGGAGAWAADMLAAAGLALPELSPELQQAIQAFIPAYGSARNPVDITAQAVLTGGLLRATEMLSQSAEVDAVLIVVSLASEKRMAIDVAALKALVARQAKPILFYSYTLPSSLARKALAEAGLTIHTDLGAVAQAMAAMARRGSYVRPRPVARPLATAPLRAALERFQGALSEYDAKELLARAGIATPPHRLVTEAGGLDAAAAALGFPLALKVQSPDIPHKTEVGGVRLGIADPAALRQGYDAMLAELRRRRPEARLQGVLLQPMAPPGIEVIVGTIRDPGFGPLVMIGAGGVLTELFKDVVYRPAPVDADGARDMLADLRIARLLGGFRGAPAADIAALAALVAQLSQFAAAHRDLVQEVELNPVIVHRAGAGCTIVDALLT